ncbi:hypothetical protein GGI12_004618 [Dipsacomyces acuminosporus]|nr:hypothetical protein GGI12_004618 [Dipsacomyces acuminosporus]
MDKREQLEKCAALLSSKSTDDEKFAGLLLVPKVVSADDSESLEYLFDKMDVKFIERLMRTGIKQIEKQAIPESSEDREIPPMLSIAIRVIDVFASHSRIAQKPRMLDRVPTLCKVVSLPLPGTSADAAQVLCRILATADQAIQRIVDQPETLSSIVTALETQKDPVDGIQFIDFTMNKCSTFLHSTGSAQSIRNWMDTVRKVASVFDSSQTILKFELISVLANCLEPFDSDDSLLCAGSGVCQAVVKHISSGCVAVLSQKSEATKYSDQALGLFSHLVRLWPDTVFSDAFVVGATAERGGAKSQKGAGLVLRLACVEGQSSIDSMMITPPDPKGKAAASPAKEKRLKLGWKLPVCCEILAGWLEWIGQWLDADQEQQDADEDAIYKIMSEIQKLVDSAIAFLVDWKERANDNDAGMLEAGPALVVSITHILTRWLATDPTMHSKAMPVLSMFASWIQSSGEHGLVIKEHVRPCISFALDTCSVDEMQYVKDLKARELHHDRTQAQAHASPWVGTIEFDDLACVVYDIPLDEQILQARRGGL